MIKDGVTIVIPNWNHEIFISRSIASAMRGVEILKDEGIAAETLVVDDQSRDGSVAMLRQLESIYFDRGLRVLSLGKNQGLAAARNYGLTEARYRYNVYLDADNELVPENLPYFYRALRETEAAAAFGNLLVREMNSRSALGVISNQSIQPTIFRGNYVDAFSMVDRIQLLDVGRYDSTCVAHEDYEMWLHLASNGRRVAFVPVTMGYYYINSNSMIKDHGQNTQANHRINRIFDQVGARAQLPMASNCFRYHPDLGCL